MKLICDHLLDVEFLRQERDDDNDKPPAPIENTTATELPQKPQLDGFETVHLLEYRPSHLMGKRSKPPIDEKRTSYQSTIEK